MARVGRTYPRFEVVEAESRDTPPEGGQGARSVRALGALLGVLAALGLIGWLLARLRLLPL